jgi:hypothetical protein
VCAAASKTARLTLVPRARAVHIETLIAASSLQVSACLVFFVCGLRRVTPCLFCIRVTFDWQITRMAQRAESNKCHQELVIAGRRNLVRIAFFIHCRKHVC